MGWDLCWVARSFSGGWLRLLLACKQSKFEMASKLLKSSGDYYRVATYRQRLLPQSLACCLTSLKRKSRAFCQVIRSPARTLTSCTLKMQYRWRSVMQRMYLHKAQRAAKLDADDVARDWWLWALTTLGRKSKRAYCDDQPACRRSSKRAQKFLNHLGFVDIAQTCTSQL